MLFNPEESIDFNGNTGPFIQYTYARIQSLIRKSGITISSLKVVDINDEEKDLIKKILEFPSQIQESARTYNPSLIANYIYELVKQYNSFYQKNPVLNCDNEDLGIFRLAISDMVGNIIKNSMKILGIDVPNQM